MHPVFLAAAIYATAVLLGVVALLAGHRSTTRHMPVPRRGGAPRALQLRPWLDLDGSARRQRQRTVSLR